MGHCPNQFCTNRTTDPLADTVAAGAVGGDGRSKGGGGPADIKADYSTLVWIYIWPNTEYSTAPSSSPVASPVDVGAAMKGALTSRLEELRELLSSGLISEQEYKLGRQSALLTNVPRI
jgi:hypothetical protein